MQNKDYFTKKFFKECLKVEVYKNSNTLIGKIWARYFKPETNSVYLIRKYLYKVHSSRNKIKICLLRKKLMIRYGIHVSENTRIGLGLDIRHPSTIMITNAKIGEKCVLFHNVTIGAKHENADMENSPVIGNNVVFYSNSACYGKIAICDNVRIGSFSCATNDIVESGTYAGVADKMIKIAE